MIVLICGIFLISLLWGNWNDFEEQELTSLPTTEFVKQLNDINSLEVAQSKETIDFWFIVYYRDNCLRCRNFIPIFNALSTSLKDTPHLKFGRVDCPNAGPVCNQIDVRNMPTIKIYYKGYTALYEGGARDASSVSKWLLEAMENDGEFLKNPPPPPPPPPVPEPLAKSDNVVQIDVTSWNTTVGASAGVNARTGAGAGLNTGVGAGDFWFVVFCKDACNYCKDFMPAFNTLADTLKDTPHLKFGRVDCPSSLSLCSAQNVVDVPIVKIFHAGHSSTIKGGRDVASLTAWLEEHMANNGSKIEEEEKNLVSDRPSELPRNQLGRPRKSPFGSLHGRPRKSRARGAVNVRRKNFN